MVANKIPNRRKCGNILINIKSVKNKNKSFTFHCTFCSTDYDQLKKFSKHIEERHLDSFEEELLIGSEVEPKSPILIFEPEEIKVEVNLDVEPLAEVGKKIGNCSEDPLRAEKSQENKFIKLYNSSECDERNIKNEHNENDNKQIKSCDIAHSDNKTQNTSKDPLESENSQQHEHNKMWECGTIKVKNEYEADRCKTANNVQEADELTSENIIKPITISPKDFNSDEFSDDSNANDFAIDTDINKASSASKLRRTRRIGINDGEKNKANCKRWRERLKDDETKLQNHRLKNKERMRKARQTWRALAEGKEDIIQERRKYNRIRQRERRQKLLENKMAYAHLSQNAPDECRQTLAKAVK